MKPVRLLSGALLLSVHLVAWPGASPLSTIAADSQSAVLSVGKEAHPRWEQLSTEERDSIRARRKQYEALPPAERQRIRDIHQRYQQLSPGERHELQERWRSQRGADNDSRRQHPRGRD